MAPQTLLIFFLSMLVAEGQKTSATVYCNASKSCQIAFGKIDANGIAFGTFQEGLNTTGWGILTIETNAFQDEYDQMFAAGYLEGAITAGHIYEMKGNMEEYFFAPPDYNPPSTLLNFFSAQDQWTYAQIAARPTDPFWHQVGNLMAQFDGLIQGYTDHHLEGQDMTRLDFQILNGVGDLLDLMNFMSPDHKRWEEMTPEEFAQYFLEHSLCSALVKITGNYSDLFSGHSSWFTYSAMNRIFKYYNFNTKSSTTHKMGFASYPGFLESLDDFYMMDSGLVMLQTTNSIFNTALYDLVVPQSLFAWQRVRVANALARSGPDWYSLVSQFNSGTYNNQYMVINYNLFTIGASLPSNTLYVIEQIPGLVVGADLTNELERGYFPSYNVPYFKKVYDLSGYPEVVSKFGNNYSYQLAPRAKIFRRDQGNVIDLASFQQLLRSNNYETHPYAAGDRCNQICCRGDLRAKPSPSGCYDTKVTSQQLLQTFTAMSINGPTTDGGLPPFSWVPFETVAHFGEPTIYDFDWLTVSPDLF